MAGRSESAQPAPNLARAAALMRECGIEAIIACSPVNVRYLTGFANWLGPSLRDWSRTSRRAS
jgi:Xaa-Pro aminopeptidase